MPLVSGREKVTWVPEEDQERISSYFKYDDIYWNVPESLKLQLRGDVDNPLYIPNPRIVVDTTAYYLLKGLSVEVENPEQNKAARDALKALIKREKFYSRFHIAKHGGVARGDFVLHI